MSGRRRAPVFVAKRSCSSQEEEEDDDDAGFRTASDESLYSVDSRLTDREDEMTVVKPGDAVNDVVPKYSQLGLNNRDGCLSIKRARQFLDCIGKDSCELSDRLIYLEKLCSVEMDAALAESLISLSDNSVEERMFQVARTLLNNFMAGNEHFINSDGLKSFFNLFINCVEKTQKNKIIKNIITQEGSESNYDIQQNLLFLCDRSKPGLISEDVLRKLNLKELKNGLVEASMESPVSIKGHIERVFGCPFPNLEMVQQVYGVLSTARFKPEDSIKTDIKVGEVELYLFKMTPCGHCIGYTDTKENIERKLSEISAGIKRTSNFGEHNFASLRNKPGSFVGIDLGGDVDSAERRFVRGISIRGGKYFLCDFGQVMSDVAERSVVPLLSSAATSQPPLIRCLKAEIGGKHDKEISAKSARLLYALIDQNSIEALHRMGCLEDTLKSMMNSGEGQLERTAVKIMRDINASNHRRCAPKSKALITNEEEFESSLEAIRTLINYVQRKAFDDENAIYAIYYLLDLFPERYLEKVFNLAKIQEAINFVRSKSDRGVQFNGGAVEIMMKKIEQMPSEGNSVVKKVKIAHFRRDPNQDGAFRPKGFGSSHHERKESFAARNERNSFPRPRQENSPPGRRRPKKCSIRDMPNINFDSSGDDEEETSATESELQLKKPMPILNRGDLLNDLKCDHILLEGKSNKDELGKNICAFLNSKGKGIIILGADPKTREVHGLRMERGERDRFRQGFDDIVDGQMIKPTVLADQVKLEFKELSKSRLAYFLIVVTVEGTPASSDNWKYVLNNRKSRDQPFVRWKNETVELTADLIRKITIQRCDQD